MAADVEPMRFEGPAGVLAGEWRAGGGRAAVVAPPHPLYGGARSHPVVQALAEALAAAGFATLAFDWRGVGGSDGRVTGDTEAAAGDYRAALAAACGRAAAPVVVGGYSFGAATAARVASESPRVGGLVLVAPPVGMMGAAALGDLTKPTDVLVGDADGYAPLADLQALAAGHAGVQLTILPGCDHFFAAVPAGDLRAALAAAVRRHV